MVRLSYSESGRIVELQWFRSAEIRKEVRLDGFVIMPNHLHGIGLIDQIVGAHSHAPENILFRPRRSLGAFIAGFKSSVTTAVNQMRKTPGLPVWQRNYFDHIIRKEESLEKTRNYIT